MKRLGLFLTMLLLPIFALAQQQQPSPFEIFATGLYQEFLNAVPTLISVVGSIFVFSWLVAWIMRRVRAVSR